VPIATDHLRVDGYANGWVIKIPGTYTLTIFYGLQSYVEFGSYVSIATILSLVSLALIKGLKVKSKNPWLRKLASITHYRKTPNNEVVSQSAWPH